MLKKQDPTLEKMDEKQQKVLDNKMEKIVAKYPKVFKGIGKVKSKPIHIFLKDNDRTPV